MLTPIDIQSKVFKGGLGYDRKDVDSFITEIIENYENLYKENVALNKKIESLTTALAQYKTIEKSLQKALLLAQKTSDDIKNQAKASAQLIEEEAHNRAEQIVADAKTELGYIHRKTMALTQQYDLYRAQFEQLARTQIAILKSETFQLKLSNMGEYVESPSKEEMPEGAKAEEKTEESEPERKEAEKDETADE